MLDIDLHNIEAHLIFGFVKIGLVYPISKTSHFVVISPMAIKLSNDSTIEIPKGFKFNGSSSPRFLWWLFPSYGDFFFASLIHDYIYSNADLSDEQRLFEERLFADKEMLLWSLRINRRNFGKTIDNYCRYWAVRLFGKKIYEK